MIKSWWFTRWYWVSVWTRIQEHFWRRLARLLPARLVYFVGIEIAAHATSGKYGTEHPPSLKLFDALDRWTKDKGVKQ